MEGGGRAVSPLKTAAAMLVHPGWKGVQNGSFGNKGCRPLDYTEAVYVPQIVVRVALPWRQAGRAKVQTSDVGPRSCWLTTCKRVQKWLVPCDLGGSCERRPGEPYLDLQ